MMALIIIRRSIPPLLVPRLHSPSTVLCLCFLCLLSLSHLPSELHPPSARGIHTPASPLPCLALSWAVTPWGRDSCIQRLHNQIEYPHKSQDNNRLHHNYTLEYSCCCHRSHHQPNRNMVMSRYQ